MITKQNIARLARTISDEFATKKIFVFGSYANGNPQEESDLDLCVILDLKGRRRIDMMRDIRLSIDREIDFPMDILVYDEREFWERAKNRSTLEYRIANKGWLING